MGITQFISPGRPIPALTKYLLTDFIVNEIDTNGNVVTLSVRPSLESEVVKQANEKVVVNFDISP